MQDAVRVQHKRGVCQNQSIIGLFLDCRRYNNVDSDRLRSRLPIKRNDFKGLEA